MNESSQHLSDQEFIVRAGDSKTASLLEAGALLFFMYLCRVRGFTSGQGRQVRKIGVDPYFMAEVVAEDLSRDSLNESRVQVAGALIVVADLIDDIDHAGWAGRRPWLYLEARAARDWCPCKTELVELLSVLRHNGGVRTEKVDQCLDTIFIKCVVPLSKPFE